MKTYEVIAPRTVACLTVNDDLIELQDRILMVL
jgi:hypothetical protein